MNTFNPRFCLILLDYIIILWAYLQLRVFKNQYFNFYFGNKTYISTSFTRKIL